MLKKLITENVVRADPNAPDDPSYTGFPGDILYNPATLELLAHDEMTSSLKSLSSSSGVVVGPTGPTGPAGPGANGATGLEKISSGTITDPVEYFDVAVPDGYVKFIFQHVGIKTDNLYGVGMALSADGGGTFYNDPVNCDTYSGVGYGYYAMKVAPDFTHAPFVYDDGAIEWDTFIQITGSNSEPVLLYGVSELNSGTVDLAPGTQSDSPLVITQSAITKQGPPGQYLFAASQAWSLNNYATTPPTLGRVNLMRILPYGNGDCNPPTSGETITSGSWVLYGVKV